MDGNNIENFEDALRMAQEQVSAPEDDPEDVGVEGVPGQRQALPLHIAEEQTPGTEDADDTATRPNTAQDGIRENKFSASNTQALEDAPPQVVQMIAQMQQQMGQLAQQNQQLKGMLAKMSNKNQAAVMEEVLTPPVLDLSGLWSEDENVIKQKQAEYAQNMADFTEKKLMSQLSPFIENAKYGLAERERREALNGLSQVPELAGIMGMTPTLERIIESNPALANANVPIEDKLITAYAIAKGAEAIKNGERQPTPPPGVEDFIQMYNQNPDLQKRVEQIRAKNAASSVANVPPMNASAGVFNAALTPQEKPKDFEEAKRLAFSRLGI